MIRTLELAFITPAFLSGADQNKPEIRTSSIRGALRWWFRVLGGSAEEERAIFGGVYGNEGPQSSAVVIRAELVTSQHVDDGLDSLQPNSNLAYLYYFAQKSGNKDGILRTQIQHYFSPGTQFNFSLSERHPLSNDLQDALGLATKAFVAFGALGLRATRGCGALATRTPPKRDDLRHLANKLEEKKVYVRLARPDTCNSWQRCQEDLAAFLKGLRKDCHISGKTDESALGYSMGEKRRESSALRLRPIKTAEGFFLPAIVYTDNACSQPSLWEIVKRRTQPL